WRTTRMNRICCVALLIFAAAILVVEAQTQEAPKKAPKPAPSASEAVLEPWNEIARKLTRDGRRLPRGQVRLQAHSRSSQLFRAPDPCRLCQSVFQQRSARQEAA